MYLKPNQRNYEAITYDNSQFWMGSDNPLAEMTSPP